jgi:hypothetical protein
LSSALDASKVVAVLLTPSTPHGSLVHEDTVRALARARRSPTTTVVPILLGGLTPSNPRIPYGLYGKQGIVASNASDFWRVAEELIQLVEGRQYDRASSHRFSDSIVRRFAEIDQRVEALTREQYRVLQLLRHCRRVRISGAAGSGKTLVAAEKACRLADAGLRVLVLCHNPVLASHLRALVPDSNVDVLDFATWVGGTSPKSAATWSHFHEPLEKDLTDAFDRLSAVPPAYDAVIVDEGQDFRAEWWILLETALKPSELSWFYIFHDDQQSLLEQRCVYPIADPVVDLSRNCRNAGRIYDLMRKFDGTLPETEAPLRDTGRVVLRRYEPGDEGITLMRTLNGLVKDQPLSDVVVLWSGDDGLAACPFAGQLVKLFTRAWQEEVMERFDTFFRAVTFDAPQSVIDEMRWHRLGPLTDDPSPTPDDLVEVAATARRVLEALEDPGNKIGVPTRIRQSVSYIYARRFMESCAYDLDWTESLPSRLVAITPYTSAQAIDDIPLYDVASFKGLEAQTIVLFARGRGFRPRQSLYVGVSRARASLIVHVDDIAERELPRFFRWE